MGKFNGLPNLEICGLPCGGENDVDDVPMKVFRQAKLGVTWVIWLLSKYWSQRL